MCIGLINNYIQGVIVMLKKLAKYGNSTTLVIDKAILELLNMDESSIVKLQTDGKSLIVTPAQKDDNQKISYDAMEALFIARNNLLKESSKKTLDAQVMQNAKKDYEVIFQKHSKALASFNSKTFSNKDYDLAITNLAQKVDPEKESAKFMKEFIKLKIEFCPEIADFEKDMEIINEKYL